MTLLQPRRQQSNRLFSKSQYFYFELVMYRSYLERLGGESDDSPPFNMQINALIFFILYNTLEIMYLVMLIDNI